LSNSRYACDIVPRAKMPGWAVATARSIGAANDTVARTCAPRMSRMPAA